MKKLYLYIYRYYLNDLTKSTNDPTANIATMITNKTHASNIYLDL